ncbi:MAG: hypothetical protein ABI276_00055 [Acidimicrobiales bacterium]
MLTLPETAARVGHYAWFERRLFEVVGAWVPTVPASDEAELEAKLHFAVQAEHHAWHAELWMRRLPEARELPRSSLTVPPSSEFAAFVEGLAAESTTLGRLVGLVRVATARLLVALDAHAGVVAPLADGSLLRTMRLVRGDLWEDVRAGERILGCLTTSRGETDAVEAIQAAMEREAGRGAGLA